MKCFLIDTTRFLLRVVRVQCFIFTEINKQVDLSDFTDGFVIIYKQVGEKKIENIWKKLKKIEKRWKNLRKCEKNLKNWENVRKIERNEKN